MTSFAATISLRKYSLLILIILPLPPQPTLIPYTTLFRSAAPQYLAELLHAGSPRRLGGIPHLPSATITSEDQASHASTRQDRKSTRLNSSHQIISYAVFCLKKNNNYVVHYVGTLQFLTYS